MRKYLTFFLALASACLLGSCSKPAAPTADYNLVATIKDIMDSHVDPSADYIWQSIGTEVSAEGIKEKRPQNPEEWKEERRRAMVLVEAANLLIMPGRNVARAHEKSDTPGVELEPAEMQVLIDKDRASFNVRARALHEAGMAATAAADAKDAQKLFEVGEQIERACEGCHLSYWYPNEKVPPVPGAPR